MKTILKSLIICLLALISTKTSGQDIHFSNFYNAPLVLNPANTGNYIGNWRLISNYRKQGNLDTEAFNTTTIAFDMPVYYYKQMGSIGLILVNDNSADNTLVVNKAFLSIAHFIKISSKSYLHMGFQFGIVQKKYSLDNLSMPDQFDMSTGYFNSDLPTSEIDMAQKFTFFDMNWGLIWSRKSAKINSEIAVAMFHYNKPNESFNSIENELPIRYVSHAYFEINLSNRIYYKPKYLFTHHNKVNEFLIGQDLGIRFNNNQLHDASIGVFYKGGDKENLDAIIAKVGFQFKSFDIGVSYDFEIPNKAIPKFSKSAIELSLQYTRPSTNLKNKTIPCETF